MTNKIRRVTCVILALVLLLSANAYAVDDLGESTFTGTIIVDSESPKLLNLGEIEIEVYQSTPIETDESYTIYSEEYAFSVYPDENGIFTFDRPSSVFSITVQVDSLPDGYGISHHTSLYSPEITSDIFTLSIVDEAEIVADSLKYPEIMLFNADGEEVYAVYEFEPTYQVLPRNDDIVEISGTVNLNGDISYNVSSNVDLPELDAIGKVELLYDVGAIDEVERIEKYIEIYEDPMIVQTLHGVTSKFIISMVYLHRIKKRLLMSIFTRSKMHTLNKMVGLRRLRQFGSPLNILVL